MFFSLSPPSSEDKRGPGGPGGTSGVGSEVVELQVGGEGHVLAGQAHVVELQVVGVTAGGRAWDVPWPSSLRPALGPVLGLPRSIQPRSQPGGSYLESRDGRREEPEERNHAITSVCPPSWPLPPAAPDPGLSSKEVSQTQPWLWDQKCC